jgi:hypothetical protein
MLSEMKSQPKNDIFSKNLRALRAGGIKLTQQKGMPRWESTKGRIRHNMWGASSVRLDYHFLPSSQFFEGHRYDHVIFRAHVVPGCGEILE